jgi:hypothetical protein
MRHPRLTLAASATALVLGVTGATAPAAFADGTSGPAPTGLAPYTYLDAVAAPGEPIRIPIGVSSPAPFPNGATLRVTRTDAAHPAGYALPDVNWPAGAPTPPVLQDTAPQQGPLSYTVTFDGDATHQAATATFTEPVAKYAPSFSMTGPTTTVARSQSLTFAGSLYWGHGHLDTGTVQVTRTDLDHPHGLPVGTATVTTDTTGQDTVTFHDTPTDGGTNTYAFTYTGGTAYLPATISDTVQVTRANTTLAVTTNAAAYTYGSWVHVFAHLGPTYNNRQVTLYAQPDAGTRTTITTGTVDANGNLAAWYKITRNTAFTAAYAGDDRYNPTTAAHVAWAYTQVNDQMLLNMSTTWINGTHYAVYYRDAPAQQPLFRTTVAPAHNNQCLSITIQRYWSGAWHTINTKSFGMLSNGFYQEYLPWNSFSNYGLYRIISEYVHNSQDITNLNTWGNWQYFTVHPHP